MRVSIELFLICLMLLGLGIAFCEAAGTANAEALNDELRNLEEQGFEFNQSPAISNSAKSFPPVIMLDSLPSRDVLLIPCSSTGQRGVNVFDPFDGAYVGSFVQDEVLFYTPINAILGPDDNIYVADQVNDAVLVFDRQGTFLYNYADDTDGLDNVRGIDFRDGHLFISISPSTGKAIAEFDGPHNRLADFINDGSDPFDIYFLDDGRALLADIYGSTDNVRLYNADGSLSGQIFSVDFPEQIQSDSVGSCPYLNTSFSDNIINDFDLSGTIEQSTPWSSGRGIYRLGNGNLLATNGNGVFEIEPGSGSIIEQKLTGSGRFIELIPYQSPVGPCDYVPGDANGSGVYNGLDVTYSVNYLKGVGPAPSDTCDCPPHGILLVAADANGNCQFNGLDVTYSVNYLKGFGTAPSGCADCPPTGLAPTR